MFNENENTEEVVIGEDTAVETVVVEPVEEGTESVTE